MPTVMATPGKKMEENIVELFHLHFLGGVQSWEERQEVFHFRQPCCKTLEGHASRFTNCAPNHTLLLGKCIVRKYNSICSD